MNGQPSDGGQRPGSSRRAARRGTARDGIRARAGTGTGSSRRTARRGAARGVVTAAVLTATLAGTVAATATEAFAPHAAAAEDERTTGLSRAQLGAEVVVGYGRGIGSSHWTPVEVTFSPQVPIVGDLAVRTDGSMGSSLRTARVEVAAGATKVIHLLLPPADDIAVGFTPQGGQPLRMPPPETPNRRDVLVGAIGEAPALPDTLTSLGSDRAIRGIAVDPGLVDAGPRALEPLDALVVPAADLAALDERGRHTLSVAVAQGLDLVVPVASGDGPLDLPWNPVESVQPVGSRDVEVAATATSWAATGRELALGGGDDRTVVAATPAGDGRVIATVAAPGDPGIGSETALWAAILQPRSDAGLPFAQVDQGTFSSSMFGGRLDLPGALGAGLFVLAFLVVVGPLNALALRRWGRRELAWVTVPAVTVVFTLIAIAGAAARAPTTSPLLRATWWVDGVGEELTAVALQSPSRGTATVELPAGTDTLVTEPWSGLVGSVAATAEATRIGVPLQAMQTATVVGWGAAPGAPPIEVTATYVDDALEVELTSRAEVPLTDVELHLATRVEQVDDLAPGETVSVTVEEVGPTLPRSTWADGRQLMQGMGMDGRVPETPGPVAAAALLQGAVLDDSPGLVWVTAAVTDDPVGTVPRITGTLEDRGSYLAVAVTPGRSSGATSPFEVQRQLLRGADGWRAGPLTVEGASEALVRFRLPPSAGRGELISTLENGGVFAEDSGDVWMDDDPWQGGCWEITVTDADGVEGEPEERCGERVACPDMADNGLVSCGGDERMVEACFDDGSCHVAFRVGDDTGADPAPDLPLERVGDGELAGVEVFDHVAGAYVPASEAFADGTGDPERLISPLGEVLLRVRGGSFIDLGRRGLGVGGSA